VVGVGLLEDKYCRNACGAVGGGAVGGGAVGGTPVPPARWGVEAEGGCWQ
jgi:hypothetical protein